MAPNAMACMHRSPRASAHLHRAVLHAAATRPGWQEMLGRPVQACLTQAELLTPQIMGNQALTLYVSRISNDFFAAAVPTAPPSTSEEWQARAQAAAQSRPRCAAWCAGPVCMIERGTVASTEVHSGCWISRQQLRADPGVLLQRLHDSHDLPFVCWPAACEA